MGVEIERVRWAEVWLHEGSSRTVHRGRMRKGLCKRRSDRERAGGQLDLHKGMILEGRAAPKLLVHAQMEVWPCIKLSGGILQ